MVLTRPIIIVVASVVEHHAIYIYQHRGFVRGLETKMANGWAGFLEKEGETSWPH